MRRKCLMSFVVVSFICGMLSLLDMFNDYFVTDKFFKTNGKDIFS